MLQELCRLIEFFYESGLLVAAAAGPSGCRGACPCGSWQAMSPPARDAAAGWRWLAGGGGLPYVLNLLQTKVARQVPAAGFGPWLWRRMGRWPGPLRRRRGRLGLPHHGF